MQPNGGHWLSIQKKTCFETGHASVSAAGPGLKAAEPCNLMAATD